MEKNTCSIIVWEWFDWLGKYKWEGKWIMSIRIGFEVLFCFVVHCCSGLIYYWMCVVIAESKVSLKYGLLYAVLFVINICSSRIEHLFIFTGSSVLCTIVMHMIVSAVVFHKRGLAWGTLTLRMFAGCLACEVASAPLVVGLLKVGVPYEKIVFGKTLDTIIQPITALGAFVVTVYCVMVTVGCIYIWRKYVKGRLFDYLSSNRQKVQYILIYARFVMFLIVLARIHSSSEAYYYLTLEENRMVSTEYVRAALMFFVLVAIVVSYFAQDLKYLSQLKRNDTLERQKAVSDALLSNLRSFRHNMVNILYGFEGVILSGNRERIAQYYQEMTQRCALVNNENIVALERVANSSVNSVLIHALDRARENQLPCNLYVQKDIRVDCRMANSDLSEVLGVLVDNAIEAAMQATVQFVSIEMRNVDKSLEILIKNTYDGQVTESDLYRGRSSKKEHMGQGLKSSYEVLDRQKTAFLNFRISGQYVQAQLLIQMK